MSEGVSTAPGSRVVDGRVVPEVDREEWGLTWNTPLETGGFLLSKSVRLEIEAELVKKS